MLSQNAWRGWSWVIPTSMGVALVTTGIADASEVDIAIASDLADTPVESAWDSPSKNTSLETLVPSDLVAEPVTPSLAVVDLLQSENISEVAPETAQVLSQISNVSELSDITPNHWAYEALRSLVEEYGVIEGYPDGTFRGDRPMTRYEFAAALNSALDSIRTLISNGGIAAEDLATIQRLQEEFAVELSSLAGRIEGLESEVAELRANQFSTTTTLRGLAFVNLSDAFAAGPITAERNPFVPDIPFAPPIRDANNRPTQVERDLPNPVFDYLLWLNLNTSFTGDDLLAMQLAAGDGTAPTNELVSSGFFNTWGAPFLETTPAPMGADNDVIIRELFYSFPVSDQVEVTVGPRINWYRHFDNNRYSFFLFNGTTFNSSGSTLANAVDRGAGAVVDWNLSPQWRVSLGYLGQNTEFLTNNPVSNPSEGLFGGTNTLTGEVGFSPSDNVNLRFLYTRSNLQANNGFVQGEPVAGIIDDGFGGPVNDATANTFIANFDWEITDNFGIFGRYSYGNTDVDPVNPALDGGSVNTQAIQFGLAFPDLGKEGARGMLSFLIPNDYLSGREYLLSGRGNGATQYEIDASYFYPINRRLAIVPALSVIGNPNGFSTNPTVFSANIRTQFSF